MEGGAGKEDSDPKDHFFLAVPGANMSKASQCCPMWPTLSEFLGLSRHDQQPEHLLRDACLMATSFALMDIFFLFFFFVVKWYSGRDVRWGK